MVLQLILDFLHSLQQLAGQRRAASHGRPVNKRTISRSHSLTFELEASLCKQDLAVQREANDSSPFAKLKKSPERLRSEPICSGYFTSTKIWYKAKQNEETALFVCCWPMSHKRQRKLLVVRRKYDTVLKTDLTAHFNGQAHYSGGRDGWVEGEQIDGALAMWDWYDNNWKSIFGRLWRTFIYWDLKSANYASSCSFISRSRVVKNLQ